MPKKALLSLFISLFLVSIIILTVSFSRKRQQIQQHAAEQSIITANFRNYHVIGKQIIDSNNNVFIPYGMQLDGILMAQPNWKTDSALTYLTQQQVQAAHDYWHANTVSLQLGSKALFAQSPYDSSYLTAVDQIINWANQLGMNVILVLQYEGYGNSGQPMPTQDSVNFWNVLSKRYATNQRVFFDVFNEPVVPGGGDDNNAAWNLWQHGGKGNDGNSYVGFQTLIDTIRNNGAQNLIFADGLAAGEDIALLPNHTLQGNNIVYAIHPYLGGQHSTLSDWDGWFGNAITNGNFPVVADEWSQYQDQYSSGQSCLTNASTLVPQFLSYLQTKHTGIIGYALFPGTLIRGWNFTKPTTFDTNPESCPVVSFPNTGQNAQGAGKLLVDYFAAHSVQYPNSTMTLSPTPLPSATPSLTVSNNTLLIFTVLLPSIGNKTPLHPQRVFTVTIYNGANQLIISKQGSITYNANKGNFTGTIDMGNISSGNYTIKIKVNGFLSRQIPGIQTITQGKQTIFPQISLIAGDINNDNKINTLDYDIIMGCYSDFLPAKDCNPNQKISADINDDGVVNQLDYNLFLREMSSVQGE